MTTLFERSAGWLNTKLQTAAGRTVVYRRNQYASGNITAVVTRHEYPVLDDGLQLTITRDDWLFVASDLLIAGTGSEPIEPREGDEIIETLGGQELIYEVLPIADRPCFEWMDTFRKLILVHSKQVT